jgi:hypothetical protein
VFKVGRSGRRLLGARHWQASIRHGGLNRVVSNGTDTVSGRQVLLRRGIGASVGHLLEIGLPAKVDRELAATLSVARLQAAGHAGSRPRERKRGPLGGAFVIRLVGALMLEQPDEGAVSRRCFSLESLARLAATRSPQLPAVAA